MDKRLASQSFLGDESERLLASSRVAVIGLSGGGSHVVQQLAHVGVGDFLLIDPDRVEYKNLNRMVGASLQDAGWGALKTAVMRRVVRRVNPRARVHVEPKKWQDVAELLRDRDVIFGCVDSFSERQQIEATARRYLIPYFDLGMDVHSVDGGFSVGGQFVCSMPGRPCLRCLGILTDERLAQEAAKYGEAGSRPQVVWSNGMLASAAVGAFVWMICPWRNRAATAILLEYDGEAHSVSPGNRLSYLKSTRCPHFSDAASLGDPFWSP